MNNKEFTLFLIGMSLGASILYIVLNIIGFIKFIQNDETLIKEPCIVVKRKTTMNTKMSDERAKKLYYLLND